MADKDRREIRLIKEEGDNWWAAIDETLDISSQGATRREALANLDGAIALYLDATEDEDAITTRDLPDIRSDAKFDSNDT